MTNYYLGIDIGSTKSHALVADEMGNAVGFGRAGPGNWEGVGWDRAKSIMHEVVNSALEVARVGKSQIAGAGFGVAGYDWPEDEEPHRRIIRSLQLNAPYILANDTLIGLVAGATSGWGVVVVAGTSNNCRGRDQQGREGRIIGSGVRFAEYAGAYEIMERALQAVGAAWTKRGKLTQLTQTFLEITGVGDEVDLLAGLMRGRYEISSDDAPKVFKCAANGDEVAQEVICWAGRELARSAVGVIRQLGFEDREFEVVLAGSLYKGSSTLIDTMREEIHAVAPGAKLIRLEAPPVVGGVLLGMEAAGSDPLVSRPRLLKSTAELLEKLKLSL